MASHWTYEDLPKTDDDLKQGDILYPTGPLQQVFKEVHPNLCDPKYLGFIVVTQCCDLVRRGNHPCKADHISIAVIRDFETLLQRFMDSVCERVSSGIYLRKSKSEAHQLVARILNQNEQAVGLFYLHSGIGEDVFAGEAIALLRVTVSLRSREHYATLQQARRGRLSSEFRNKLGWLVGNLYSRIGAPDWTDQENGADQLKALVEKFIDSEQYAWVEESWVRAAKEKNIPLDELSATEVIRALEDNKPAPLKRRIADEVGHELARLLSNVPRAIAGSVSKTIAEELSQCGVSITKREIESTLTQSLSDLFQDVPANLATMAASKVIAGQKMEEAESTALGEKFQAKLKKAIAMQVQELPKKLSNRLANAQIVSRVVDREDAY